MQICRLSPKSLLRKSFLLLILPFARSIGLTQQPLTATAAIFGKWGVFFVMANPRDQKTKFRNSLAICRMLEHDRKNKRRGSSCASNLYFENCCLAATAQHGSVPTSMAARFWACKGSVGHVRGRSWCWAMSPNSKCSHVRRTDVDSRYVQPRT